MSSRNKLGFPCEVTLYMEYHMEWYPLQADRDLFILSQKLEGDRIILHLFNYGLVPVIGISCMVNFVCFLYGLQKLYAIFMGPLEVSGF
jgi:hypothetical protein